MSGVADEGLSGPGAETEASSPQLALEGFSGRLELLLALARAERVDLAAIPFTVLADQLATSLQQVAPIARKGDWLVMAAWLLLLRSRLLLPSGAPEQRAAEAALRRLRGSLVQLQQVQALAGWLSARPQLGRDVLRRGRPGDANPTVEHEGDIIELLWASVALFGDSGADRRTVYRPVRFDLFSVAEARARVMRRLERAAAPLLLEQLLPNDAVEPAEAGRGRQAGLSARLAWASTFVASLELAKQGLAACEQQTAFSAISVAKAR